MSEVNLNDVPTTQRVPLPRGQYVVRIVNAVFGKSKTKGTPMVTLTMEIVTPETVKYNDQVVKIASVQLTEYLIMLESGMSRVKALHKVLGLPMTINTEAPNTRQYLGKAFAAALASDVQAMKDENTGEPILDPETGNPIENVNYKISRYLFASPQHNVEVPY